MVNENFGTFFRACRMRLEKPLRSFCRDNELDPAYISRLERGIACPPASKQKLEQLAVALGLIEDSVDWNRFFDLASISTGRIPSYILEDKELLPKLPIVFRTIEGAKITPEKLDELIELVRET